MTIFLVVAALTVVFFVVVVCFVVVVRLVVADSVVVTVAAELEKVADEEVLGNERLLELLSLSSPQAVSKSKADVKRAAKILFNSIPPPDIDNKCQSCIIWFVEEIHIPVVSVHTGRSEVPALGGFVIYKAYIDIYLET